MNIFHDSQIINQTSHNTTATLTTALTGANNDLTFTAVTVGSAGNDVTIAYVNPETTADLAVTVVDNAITVNLAWAVDAITSTALEIESAIEASAAASALVTVETAAENTGAGVVTAMAATHLSGGSDYVYSPSFDLSQEEDVNGIQMTIDADTFTGIDSLTVTMQYSYDQITWYSGTAFTALTDVGSETKYINGISAAIGPFVRFRYDAETVVADKAVLSTALTGNNNDLDYTAVDGGTQGNLIKIKYTNPGVAGATESVSVSTDDGTDITTIDFSLATTAAVKAAYTTSMTGANNDIVITAVTAGTAGNAIDFTMTDPNAASQPLTVTTTGSAIVVSLATNSEKAITSTANQVIAAVNGDYLAQKLVKLTLSGSDTGATAVTALSKVDLADGAAGGVISSTGDTIKATLAASAAASALVTAADKAANDGSGAVTAMAATALTGGTDNVVVDVWGITK